MNSMKIAGAFAMAATLLPFCAWAQGAGCSDDFSVSNLGPGKAWTFIDADNAAGGSGTVQAGKLELSGRGADIYKTRNEFVGVYRSDIKGDFDVSVKIESQENIHEWSQAGIIVANDIADLKKGGYVAFDISPANGFTFFYDKTDSVGQLDGNLGGGKTAYPAWLRLSKKGAQFSAWYKTRDTAAWTQVQPNLPISQLTGTNSQIGLFSVSHDATKTGKTIFDDFTCLNGTTFVQPIKSARQFVLPSSLNGAWLDAKGRVHQSERLPAGSFQTFKLPVQP